MLRTQELPAPADHDPAEAGEPRALLQRLQKARDVAAVLDEQVDVQPAAAGEALAGLADCRSRPRSTRG